MKKEFPEFYRLEDEEIKSLWADCIFVFDANVLLNLYRYSLETSENLIEVLKSLSDRIWIPHQFAYEYQKNRASVIEEQRVKYNKSVDIVVSELDKIKDLQSNYFKTPTLDISAFQEGLVKSKETYPDCSFEDKTRGKMDLLFEGKVGDLFDDKKRNSVIESGFERYKQEVPPGYCDAKEKDKDDPTKTRKFGDLIGWVQMIEKSKQIDKSVIFITSERKEDWWQIVKGKTIGPRFELIKEFGGRTGKQFHMYDMKRFLDYAKESYTVTEKTLDEVAKKDKLYNDPLVSEKVSLPSNMEAPFGDLTLVGEWREAEVSDSADIDKEIIVTKKEVVPEESGQQIDF